MFRGLQSGIPALLRAGMLAGVIFGVGAGAGAAAKSPFSGLSPGVRIVKDQALARVLGEALFRDTVEAVSEAPTAAQVALPSHGSPERFGGNPTGQVVHALLARHPVEKYRWLIERAFDDSVWKGAGRSQVERNFPLIWRISIMLYESTLDSSQARVRVCAPDDTGDGFNCTDESRPARIVPIPSPVAVLQLQDQPNSG